MLEPEKYREIELYAYAYLSKSEIALITEIDPELFLDDTEVIKAFNIGRLKRKAEYNNEVIALSKQLSSPAMLIESKLAEQAALNDLS